MTINELRRLFRRRFLTQRMRDFVDRFGPDAPVLDVGGTPYPWNLVSYRGRVTLLNLSLPEERPEGFDFIAGDGTRLDFADGAFDTVFSNSVIEHLTTWERQVELAAEARRVGRRLWIQTPARIFPFEPHFFAPFIHWLPMSWRLRLAPFTPWGLMKRGASDDLEQMVREIRLLSHSEMKRLFPDCEIRTERFLGWPKSYIALR